MKAVIAGVALAGITLVAAVSAQVVGGLSLAKGCEPTVYGNRIASIVASDASGDGAATPEARLRTAVERQPESIPAVLDLARCLYSERRLDDAREQFARALTLVRAARQAEPASQSAGLERLTKTFGDPPSYPAERQDGLAGVVFILASIDARGKVRDARVVGSVPEFDSIALASVRAWTFEPHKNEGRAVPTQTLLRLKMSPTPELRLVDIVDIARFSASQRLYDDAEEALGQLLPVLEREQRDLTTREEAWQACAKDAPRFGVRDETTAGITWPTTVNTARAAYPQASLRAAEFGRVSLEMLVDTQGRVPCAHVTASRTPRLDQAALEAVRQWTFEAATRNGQATAVVIGLTIDFSSQLNR